MKISVGNTLNIILFAQLWRINGQYLVTNSWSHHFMLKDASCVCRLLLAYTSVVIKHYYLSGCSYAHIKTSFFFFFLIWWKHLQMQIKWIVDCFEPHNQISDLQKPGWPHVRTLELVEEVRGRLSTTHNVLSRRLAQNIGASHSSTYRMMRSIKYPTMISHPFWSYYGQKFWFGTSDMVRLDE